MRQMHIDLHWFWVVFCDISRSIMDAFASTVGTGGDNSDRALGTANCNRNEKIDRIFYWKCRRNGELPLKNDGFLLRNVHLFCNSRHLLWGGYDYWILDLRRTVDDAIREYTIAIAILLYYIMLYYKHERWMDGTTAQCLWGGLWQIACDSTHRRG